MEDYRRKEFAFSQVSVHYRAGVCTQGRLTLFFPLESYFKSRISFLILSSLYFKLPA